MPNKKGACQKSYIKCSSSGIATLPTVIMLGVMSLVVAVGITAVSLTESFAEINLPIGATASVEVISGRVENAVLVSVEALHEIRPGEYAVYVVENNQPKLRMIEVGLQDLLYAEVKSGLKPGELVATSAVEVE